MRDAFWAKPTMPFWRTKNSGLLGKMAVDVVHFSFSKLARSFFLLGEILDIGA